jgi:hypothetical protein
MKFPLFRLIAHAVSGEGLSIGSLKKQRFCVKCIQISELSINNMFYVNKSKKGSASS